MTPQSDFVSELNTEHSLQMQHNDYHWFGKLFNFEAGLYSQSKAAVEMRGGGGGIAYHIYPVRGKYRGGGGGGGVATPLM